MANVSSTMAYGRVNLEGRSLQAACLRVNMDFSRDSAVNSGKRDPMQRRNHPVSRHSTEGGFTAEVVTHPEGTILLFTANQTLRAMPYAQAGLFIRLRNDGDMISVKLRIPTNHLTILGDRFEVFRGRGDVLSDEDLRNLGVDVPPKWSRTYRQKSEIAELYSVDVIAKGKPMPKVHVAKVQTATGEEIVTLAAEPVRTVRRRRG